MAALLVIIASGASGDVQGACQCEGNNFSSDCLHDLFRKQYMTIMQPASVEGRGSDTSSQSLHPDTLFNVDFSRVKYILISAGAYLRSACQRRTIRRLPHPGPELRLHIG